MKVAVLIPEWPGQTHVWMWREFVELRKLGLDLELFSTRRPRASDAARHAFAPEAERATRYLWPMGVRDLLGALAFGFGRPARTLHAAALALTIRDRRGRHSLRNLGLFVAALLLARSMTSRGCRHLYVHSAADSALIGRFAGLVAGRPYSVVVNANLEWWGGALEQKLGHAASVIAHAQWIFDDILRRVPSVQPARVVLAPVGVDLSSWAFRRGRSNLSPPLRLVSVGRLHPAKGHATVIRAVGALRQTGLDVRLKILGGGPQQEELAQLIRSLSLDSAVDLAGSVAEDRVREELAAADIFVLASQWEPLGVVYMEAMAIGLPVIGTRNGGVTEIVDHGRSGLLVDPESEAQIVDAVLQLARDSALRERMAEAGRAKVVQAFDSRMGAARVGAALSAEPETAADGGVAWAHE